MQVPLSSWQVGPWNRWSYQHVGEVVPTVRIRRDAGRTWSLPGGDGGLDDLAGGLLETAHVDGVAVLHDGVFVLERYANGMESHTRHLSQSVGKSVLGLLVGALAERGELDVESEVTELTCEFALLFQLLRFLVVAPAEPLRQYEEGKPREAWAPRTDVNGEVLWRLQLVAFGEGEAEISGWRCRAIRKSRKARWSRSMD